MNPNDITAPSLTGLSTPALPTLGNGTSLTGDISSGQDALSQLQAQSQPQPEKAEAAQKSGNLFERLLPTLGGIAGAVAGAPLDPLTGGAASIGLSGLLSGAGKAAENALTGQKVLQGSDLVSGLEGAGGQFGGQLLGKGLEAGGGLLSKLAANGTASRDAAAAEDQALNEAKAIHSNYGGTKPGVQSANNMANNLDLLKSFGVDHTSPEAMQQASNGGLFINNLHNEALGAGEPIETPSLLSGGSNTGNLVQSVLKSSPEEQEALKNAGLLNDFNALPETVSPLQANQYAQELGAQLRDVRATMDNAQANGRVADYNAAKTQYSKLESTYKDVQSKLGTPQVNKAIADRTITPEEKQSLVDTYGQQQADYMENAVNNAKTHQDLVKAKLPFAQMNTISKQALSDMQAPATARGVARTQQGSTAGNLINGGIDLGGLYEGLIGGHPLALAAPLARRAIESPELQAGAGGLLSKLGGSVAPNIATQVVANSPNDVPAAQQGGSTIPDMNGNLQNSALEAALRDALQQGNLQAEYPFMPNSGSMSSQLPALIQASTQASSAEKDAQQLASLFAQAGGGQGPVGGLLSRLGQTVTGGPASFLGSNLNSQEQATEKALQANGATPGMMPQVTQSPQAAQAALEGIQRLLASLGGGQAPASLSTL